MEGGESLALMADPLEVAEGEERAEEQERVAVSWERLDMLGAEGVVKGQVAGSRAKRGEATGTTVGGEPQELKVTGHLGGC